MEKDTFQEWMDTEKLWQLSDPTIPTFIAGATTDGVFLAPGTYLPQGILPQRTEEEQDEGPSEVYPIFVTPKRVLADHHALFSDILTPRQEIPYPKSQVSPA